MFYAVGMHGYIMFRPHMKEDWIIWSLALTAFLPGVMLIVLWVRKRSHNRALPK
jgi:hypothetical protein